jgi:outer membrane protein insertion porin family
MLKIISRTMAIICLLFLSLFHSFLGATAPQVVTEHEVAAEPKKIIRTISIRGNKLITQEALKARIPFREGESYNAAKTGDLIRNLYSLPYFNEITLDTEEVSPTEINLIITVQEKKKVESVRYEGNKAFSEADLEKELKLADIPAMDEEELSFYASKIRKLYTTKNYHATSVEAQLVPTDHGTVCAVFTICEGPKSAVRRVLFEGNTCVQGRILRKLIFTREEWLFGFLNKAGTYQPDMLDIDKFIIEAYYQSNGFLAARVTDITVDRDPVCQDITVTYSVDEGPQFTVAHVSAPGNDIIAEADLLRGIPIKPGHLYSRDDIRTTIEALRSLWGRFGYIYADIEPVIIPNFENKTVDITFNSDLGRTYFLNQIFIRGNAKTRDYVIRRMLTLCEGQLLSLPAMDQSKSRVESLGYFDPQGGVDWKITKVSEDSVDLDLVLKEIKTGNISAQLGYGGADPQSPSTSVRIGGTFSDKNFLGTGIRGSLSASFSKQDRLIVLNFFQPWLFNRPIGGGLGFYHRSSLYEDFENISTAPKENLTGADAQLLFYIPGFPDLSTSITGGVERIRFQKNLRAATGSGAQNALLQSFIDRRFVSGTSGFVGYTIGQDVRNHPVFPNKGYNWSFTSRMGIPTPGSTFGYVKADFDATWLTPLIGDYDLVFLLHGHAGIVGSLSDKIIPYRDLYNIGGPATVRGFDFGQIGPQVTGGLLGQSSSVGAKKAFWINAELIFSITRDQSIRGLVFYDGGAGWDTPLTQVQRDLILLPENAGSFTNNRFRYRHSVGFGLRLMNPAPIRIDWGFKLDRNKRNREKFYEVHFSMNQEF